jgi:2'-hydroxyisoflavone reductase
MRLLVLGGRVFLGRHLVEAALRRGHRVTTFTRGRHGAELFPEAEALRGDREGDLSALRGRRWDAVIDTSGHSPGAVAASAALLSGAVGHYVFTSSVAAYEGFPETPGLDETAPLRTRADGVDARTPETVGPLKALCEREVERALPGRALLVRAGLLAGPHDPTDRFTWWPLRVARGGEVLAPGGPALPVQFVDARDLAEWMLDATERGLRGAFNATGPARPLTLGGLLDACRAVPGGDARFTWAEESFLLAAGVRPRMELPLWMPGAPGASTVDARRAIAAGLAFRPLADTLRDTYAWAAARPPGAPLRAGHGPAREAALLAAWHARTEASHAGDGRAVRGDALKPAEAAG